MAVVMVVVVVVGGGGGGDDEESIITERKTDRRYNFYTSLTKRPGRLGDYRVLTTPLGRPPQPTPVCLFLQISSTLTLFCIDIRLMSCNMAEVLGASWTRASG